MKMIIFLTLFLSVFVLLSLYINRRLITHLHVSRQTKRYLRTFLILNLLGIMGYIFARYVTAMPGWLYFLLSLPIGVLFLLFCAALLYDLFRVGMERIPMKEERRSFFKKSLDIGALGLAFGVSAEATREARNVELETVTIALNNLHQSYSAVQLSDLHIGGLINAKFIERIVNRVNALSPDIIVITGDLVDIELSHAKKALKALSRLKSRYGTFYVVGNHEYFHGIEGIIEGVKSLGITVLENENHYIGEAGKGFWLAGVYDLFGYRTGEYIPDISKALKGTQESSPIVLLAHQPRFVAEAEEKVDLMLSGHTHGGQLFPFKVLVKLQQPYVSGLHQHSVKTQVYVSKGTGFWGPPMRLGASSEITHIKFIGG